MNHVLEAIAKAVTARAKWRPTTPADERIARDHPVLYADFRRAFLNGYAAERLRRTMNQPNLAE